MKELTIEQKAKAYDEAVEKARIWKDKSGMPKDKQGILDDIFPELAESEDEKIRKAIRTIILSASREQTIIVGVTQSDMFAWLEKQGEQKPADTNNKFIRMRETKPKDISEFLDRLTTVEQEFLWEHIAKIRELDKEEQKLDKIICNPNTCMYAQNYRDMQKPVEWSEEDEKIWEEISDMLWDKHSFSKFSWDDIRNWIKPKIEFFKERVQPKNEWIKNKAEKYIVDTPLCSYFDYKRAVEDFKNYMKGE